MFHTRVLMIETPTYTHFVKNIVHRTSCGVEIIGVAAVIKDALELICTQKPDVLIIDIRDSKMESLDALMKIRSEYPHAQIIGRIKNPEYEYLLQAIMAGAMGFVNDQTPFSELIDAIAAVKGGYAYLPQNLARQFVNGLHYQSSIKH